MPTKKKQKKKINTKEFRNWSLTFTKRLILIITAAWIIYMTYAAFLITVAIYVTNNFSYLDSFIVQNNETFRLIVGINLISKTTQNIFQYNESNILGKSLPYVNEDDLKGDKSDD